VDRFEAQSHTFFRTCLFQNDFLYFVQKYFAYKILPTNTSLCFVPIPVQKYFCQNHNPFVFLSKTCF